MARRRIRAVRRTLLVLTTLLTAQAAQDIAHPAPTANDPVIKVTVGLVQIDAVVTDSQGHHIPNLKPEDFQVIQDGKPRKITQFSFVAGKPTSQAVLTALPAGPAKRPRREDIRRTMVLVADTLGLSFQSTYRIRNVLRKFVDEQMQAGDLVSIMTTGGGSSALQGFTTDKTQLNAAIDKVLFLPGRRGIDSWDDPNAVDKMPAYLPTPRIRNLAKKLDEQTKEATRRVANLYAVGTLGALNYAVEDLARMPGRKAIAFFSDGLAVASPDLVEAIGHTVELANRSSVVFYTFDAQGLIYYGFGDGNFEQSQVQEGGLSLLASETGGLFFHNTNGIGQSLAAALDDVGSYYLIGYEPDFSDFAERNGEIPFHRIRVKATRAGLHVRSRDGFFGVPDDASGSNYATREQQIRAALFSPFASNSVPVRLTAHYSATRDPKNRKLKPNLRVLLSVDTHSLNFEDAPGGKKKVVFDVLAAAWGASSKPLTSIDRTVTFETTPDEMEHAIASGMAFDFPEITPGPYQVRAAVRAVGSGETGSATAFVDIPDFNRSKLALSSILLTSAISAPGTDPATRIFATGATLDYDSAVFGSRAEPVDISVDLYRGPEHIYTGARLRLPNPLYATGQVKLPPTLPPGDYSMELQAFPDGKSKDAATQWVDFTLKAP